MDSVMSIAIVAIVIFILGVVPVFMGHFISAGNSRFEITDDERHDHE